ncbi:MAG: hypothetical protein AAF624_15030 [Bacteroidota bacterium]
MTRLEVFDTAIEARQTFERRYADFDLVEHLGDEARYDGTVRVTDLPLIGRVREANSAVKVRAGKAIMSVEVDHFDPGEDLVAMRAGPSAEIRATNRVDAIQLASLVLRRLEQAHE